jgi:hypothetical protein
MPHSILTHNPTLILTHNPAHNPHANTAHTQFFTQVLTPKLTQSWVYICTKISKGNIMRDDYYLPHRTLRKIYLLGEELGDTMHEI